MILGNMRYKFKMKFKNMFSDKKDRVFRNLVAFIYKVFNVVEINDTVYFKEYDFKGAETKTGRVLDFYSDGGIDIVCDSDQSPMRIELPPGAQLKLKSKFFKAVRYSDFRRDNGWRAVFVNINKKRILPGSNTI